jgi:hypothetical protein
MDPNSKQSTDFTELPALDFSDYLLLSYLHELKSPIHYLLESKPGEVFNLPDHHLQIHEVPYRLLELFKLGFIEVERDEKPSILTDEEFLMVLQVYRSREYGFFFGLTEAGGSKWEEFAQPKWPLFLSDFDAEIYSQQIRLICHSANRGLLLRVCNVLNRVLQVQIARMQIHEVGRWRPLYWKWLSLGHRLIIDTSESVNGKLARAFLTNDFIDDEKCSRELSRLRSLWKFKFYRQIFRGRVI